MINKLIIQLIIYTITITLCGQNKGITSDMDEWNNAIETANISSIDSLIKNETSFKYLNEKNLDAWRATYCKVRENMLDQLYYLSLEKNREYGNAMLSARYYCRANVVRYNYQNGDFDEIYGNNVLYIYIQM